MAGLTKAPCPARSSAEGRAPGLRTLEGTAAATPPEASRRKEDRQSTHGAFTLSIRATAEQEDCGELGSTEAFRVA